MSRSIAAKTARYIRSLVEQRDDHDDSNIELTDNLLRKVLSNGS